MTNSLLVAIVGPTGSGKSALALALAQAKGGEIVNFDSVQVYRGLNIGSAKTAPQDRQGIPHHLLDVVAPSEDFTAGTFSRLARERLGEMSSRGAIPVLVGGTGFYLRSLLDGLSPAPPRDSDLRARLTEVAARRPTALHRLLRRVDPDAAGRIHANDHQKLIRAIELGATVSSPSPRQPLEGFRVVKIGLNPPRAELYVRINQRTVAMFDGGLLEETQGLLDSGLTAKSKGLQTLGYKQAVAVIEGRMNIAEAIAEVQTKTRQYAKRQLTWFRQERGVQWLDGFGESTKIRTEAVFILGV